MGKISSCILLFWLLFSYNVHVTESVTTVIPVTLTSTLSDKQTACPGDVVTFTCVTRGSLIIAWLSDNYFDGRVEFASFDVGRPQVINSNAISTLVSTEVINEIRILTSQLMITVSSDYVNSTITCLHVGHLVNTSISFGVPDIPGMAIESVAVELQETQEGCFIFMQWMNPINADTAHINYYHISITDSEPQSAYTYRTFEVSRVLYFANCTTPSISIKAVDKCNREGLSTIVPFKQIPLGGNDEITTMTNEATTGSPTTVILMRTSASLIAGILILLTFPLLLLAIVIVVIITCRLKLKKLRTQTKPTKAMQEESTHMSELEDTCKTDERCIQDEEVKEPFHKQSSVTESQVPKPLHRITTTESDGQSLIIHSSGVCQEFVPREEGKLSIEESAFQHSTAKSCERIPKLIMDDFESSQPDVDESLDIEGAMTKSKAVPGISTTTGVPMKYFEMMILKKVDEKMAELEQRLRIEMSNQELYSTQRMNKYEMELNQFRQLLEETHQRNKKIEEIITFKEAHQLILKGDKLKSVPQKPSDSEMDQNDLQEAENVQSSADLPAMSSGTDMPGAQNLLEKEKQHGMQNLQKPTEPGPVAVTSPAESTVGDGGVSTAGVAATGPHIKSTSETQANLGAIDFSSGPGSLELKKKQDMVGEGKRLETSPSETAMTVERIGKPAVRILATTEETEM